MIKYSFIVRVRFPGLSSFYVGTVWSEERSYHAAELAAIGMMREIFHEIPEIEAIIPGMITVQRDGVEVARP